VVGPSTTPSNTKGKQPVVISDESDTEPEGVYRHSDQGETSTLKRVFYEIF